MIFYHQILYLFLFFIGSFFCWSFCERNCHKKKKLYGIYMFFIKSTSKNMPIKNTFCYVATEIVGIDALIHGPASTCVSGLSVLYRARNGWVTKLWAIHFVSSFIFCVLSHNHRILLLIIIIIIIITTNHNLIQLN